MPYPRIAALLFLSCAGAFLSGCHNEDDEPTGPQTILTLQVDAGYGLQRDTWIFASDENGEILDAQPYTGGQTVTLTSEKRPSKINVTLFMYIEHTSEDTQIFFDTWAGIASGTTLHFKVGEAPVIPERGKATIRVSNYPSPTIDLGVSNGYSYNYSASLGDGTLELDLSFYGVPSDILLYGWRSGVPVYYWAAGVKSNDIIERDYVTDFIPYPHQFKLDFAGRNSAIIRGHDAKTSRDMTLLETSTYSTGDHPVIGYLDGFDSYDMWVANTQANGQSTTYHQKGAIDFSFDMPTYTFSQTNSDFQNFSFNFSHHYTYHTASWQHVAGTEYTWWNINAPSGYAVKGLSIPSEITAKYPQLDVNKLVHTSLTFTEIIKGRSYEELVPGATIANSEGTVEEYVYRVR